MVPEKSIIYITAVGDGLGREKCLKDPTHVIFSKSWGFRDVKYVIPMFQCCSVETLPQIEKQLQCTQVARLNTGCFFLTGPTLKITSMEKS